MEPNTILLDVEKYNELRDFKLNIEKGNTLYVYNNYGHYGAHFITESEAVEKLTKHIKELDDIIDELKNPKTKEIDIREIKRMSIFEFLKWRKS